MRRAGPWAWVGACVFTLACSGAPSSGVDERDADRVPIETVHAGPSGRADDLLLSSAREQMRAGRVPDSVREQLLASRDPDHRHAARLLQAVAGETPAAVLSRAVGGPEQEIVEAPSAEFAQPQAPPPAEPPEPIVALAESDPSDDVRLDPLPKLDDVPPESPLRAWLAGESELEPDPPPPSIELPIEPELLLLRERPPRPPTSDGLVILTSMNLLPGQAAGELWLVLAGSGPATVLVQPLDEYRVRLTVADAGAVPSFLAARPGESGGLESLGLMILDVARHERDVELELGLVGGWRLVAVEQLGNGATVKFSRSDTLPPS